MMRLIFTRQTAVDAVLQLLLAIVVSLLTSG
jgi:hypothetical protein